MHCFAHAEFRTASSPTFQPRKMSQSLAARYIYTPTTRASSRAYLLVSSISSTLPGPEQAEKKQAPARKAESGRRVMAAAWWWWLPLPAWLGSGALWFVVLNAVVAAVAFLSSRARPPPLLSPRRGAGVTRRASSAVLQRLRSSSIFSFPSACLSYLQPDATALAASQETREEPVASPTPKPSPRALALPPPTPPPAHAHAPAAEDGGNEDPDSMSMDEAYALAVAARRRPEREREEEARRSEVDAKAEEFIRGFKDDLRQQRLKSIFNYTQMLKQRALGGGRRQPEARPDQL